MGFRYNPFQGLGQPTNNLAEIEKQNILKAQNERAEEKLEMNKQMHNMDLKTKAMNMLQKNEERKHNLRKQEYSKINALYKASMEADTPEKWERLTKSMQKLGYELPTDGTFGFDNREDVIDGLATTATLTAGLFAEAGKQSGFMTDQATNKFYYDQMEEMGYKGKFDPSIDYSKTFDQYSMNWRAKLGLDRQNQKQVDANKKEASKQALTKSLSELRLAMEQIAPGIKSQTVKDSLTILAERIKATDSEMTDAEAVLNAASVIKRMINDKMISGEEDLIKVVQIAPTSTGESGGGKPPKGKPKGKGTSEAIEGKLGGESGEPTPPPANPIPPTPDPKNPELEMTLDPTQTGGFKAYVNQGIKGSNSLKKLNDAMKESVEKNRKTGLYR